MLNYCLPLVLFLVIGLSACKSGSSDRKERNEKAIVVFAAASVTDVMLELTQTYEKNSGRKVKLNLASSGILARQIEQGAPCDVYVSASKKWMNYVSDRKLIQKESYSVLAKNHLVAIVPSDRDMEQINFHEGIDLASLFTGRLSLGDPAHVPAGVYAMEALVKYNWNVDLKDRLLPAKDVRDALMMVEIGEAELGIVYASDAQKSSKVKTLFHFPDNASSPIFYYGGLGANTKSEGVDFFQFIKSKPAKDIWKRNGFKITDKQ